MGHKRRTVRNKDDRVIRSVNNDTMVCVVCAQVVEDTVVEESVAMARGSEEELLPCPICFKTCSSRLELDAHMDTHPDTALRYTHARMHTQL